MLMDKTSQIRGNMQELTVAGQIHKFCESSNSYKKLQPCL